MVEVGVTDEYRLEGGLSAQLHAARQGARVDRNAVVDDERARPMLGRLAAVATNDPELHGALLPFTFAGQKRFPDRKFTAALRKLVGGQVKRL